MFSIASKFKAFIRKANGEEIEIGQLKELSMEVDPVTKAMPDIEINKPIKATATIALDSWKVERGLLRLFYRAKKRRHINCEKARRMKKQWNNLQK